MRTWIWGMGLAAAIGTAGVEAGCVTGCARQAAADVATSWNGDSMAPTRLILASPSHAYGGPVWVALELDIEDGWYVYAAGASGPKLEWSGSANLAPPALRWPEPEWVDLNGRARAVYRGHVILPVSIAPLQPDRDIELGLHVSYAVCADVCRPGFAVHHIRIMAAPVSAPPAAARQAAAIAGAIADAP